MGVMKFKMVNGVQAWVLCALFGLIGLEASAQPQVSPSRRDLIVTYQRAVSLLESGDRRNGITSLHEVVLGLGSKDDVLLSAKEGLETSLKLQCFEQFRKLTDEDIAFYEQQFGPEGQARLRAARTANDLDLMESVSRLYFFTKAGTEATRELALRRLDRGEALDAALALSRLLHQARNPDQFEPGLSFMLASAWARAGVKDEAKLVLDRLAASGNSDLTTPEGDLSIRAGEWPDWLPSDAYEDGAWLMPGGDAKRSRESERIVPSWRPLWRANVLETFVVETPGDNERVANGFDLLSGLLTDYQRLRERQRRAAIPALAPLVLQDRVVFRTPLTVKSVRMRAGDSYSAGELEWETYKPDPFMFSALREASLPRDLMEPARVYGYVDVTSGVMSSDGQFAYVIEETDRMSDQRLRRVGGRDLLSGEPNFLRAYELSSGSVAWQIGGERGIRIAGMRDTVFLGPPLPFGRDLLQIVASRDELRLLQLHVENPTAAQPEIRLVWSQRLSQISADLGLETGARLSGLTPAYANGVLVCPTGVGDLVGLDPASRSLLWRYKKQIRPAFARASRNVSPRIVDDLVIWSPPGLDTICCLNLQTGEERWSIEQPTTQWFAANERFVVSIVGDEVNAILTTNGKPAWSRPIRIRLATGRGLLHGDTLSIPVGGRQAITIDVPTGRILARSKSPVELGNLVAVGDVIVSQSPKEVVAFSGFRTVDKELTRGLRDNPKNVNLLVTRAIQQLQADDPAGLQTLRLAAEQPGGDVAARLLVDRVTARKGSELRKQIRLLDGIKVPSPRVPSLEPKGLTGPIQLVAQSLSELQDASKLRIQIARLDSEEELDRGRAAELLGPLFDLASGIDHQRYVLHDDRVLSGSRRLASEMRRYLRSASDLRRAVLLGLIEERVEFLFDAGRNDAAMRTLDWLESPPVALLLASASSLKGVQPGRAMLQLKIARAKGNKAQRREATRRLLEMLFTHRRDRARALVAEVLSENDKDATLLQQLSVNEQLSVLVEQPRVWPAVEVSVETAERYDKAFDFEPRQGIASLGHAVGAWTFYLENGRTVGYDQSLEKRFDADVLPFGAGVSQRDAYVVETDSVLVVPGTEVSVFDLLSSPERPKVLWTARIEPPSKMSGRLTGMSRRPVGPIGGNTVLLKTQRGIAARDLFSGEVLWSRDLELTNSNLYADSEFVVVEGTDFIDLYSLFDGKWIARQPLHRSRSMLIAEMDRGQLRVRLLPDRLEVGFANFGEVDWKWSHDVSLDSAFSPPVDGHFAVFDLAASKTHVFRMRDGRRVASVDCDDNRKSGPLEFHVTPDEFVVLKMPPPARPFRRVEPGSEKRHAIAIDRRTGEKLWEQSIGSESRVDDGDFVSPFPRRYVAPAPLGPNLPLLVFRQIDSKGTTYRVVDCRTGQTLRKQSSPNAIYRAVARRPKPGVLRIKIGDTDVSEFRYGDK